MAEIERVEALMSTTRETSDIWKLNEQAGSETELNTETLALLRRAREFWKMSDGAFDITVEPLVKLWDITGEGYVPNDEEIAETLQNIGMDGLSIGESTACLKEKNMGVTLGAIAKGYAADCVAALLTEEGVEHAIIDLGHNIVTIGSRPDGTPWRVGVQKPFGENGEYAALLASDGGSIVTSGTYERYFERDGVRYHHVLDPHTGRPSESGLISATIIADCSADADALSTTCLLLGEEKALALIEKLDGIEALLICEDGSVALSSGMQAYMIG